MTTYEPGTVAVATVRGLEGVRVVRSGGMETTPFWWTPVYVGDARGNEPQWRTHDDRDVTDVRPLVVLDLSEQEHFRIGIDCGLTNLRSSHSRDVKTWIADQIEAQTKPPRRIPEPGLWGVVEGGTIGRRFFVHLPNGWAPASDLTGMRIEWDKISDPALIREGLS